MTFVYLICFLLLAVGAVLLLKLTPERITGDLMRFVSPKQTLRDKVLTRKGELRIQQAEPCKKSRKRRKPQGSASPAPRHEVLR